MEYDKLDIHKLVILWQATVNIPEVRSRIEVNLYERIESNKRFSREFIFDILFISKKSLAISFIPTSESYNKYGQTNVVEGNYSDNEAKELLENFRLTPPKNTYGIVLINPLYIDDLTTEQIETLKTEGFETKDILAII